MKDVRVRGSAALLVLVAISGTNGEAAAASEVGLGAAYDVRVPVGDFRRLVPDASFAGLQVKWEYHPNDALAVGLQVQYNLFERPKMTDTVAIADGAITGTSFRYASFWSAIPTVRYYLGRSALRPYAELGVGLVGATSVLGLSDRSQRDVSTALMLQPSAGVLLRLTPARTSSAADGDEAAVGSSQRSRESMFGLTASATYAFTTADVVGANNVAYAGIQFGIYAKP